MSVSEDLLYKFELIEPLHLTASKNHKGQIKRDNMLNKPVSLVVPCVLFMCNDAGSQLLTNHMSPSGDITSQSAMSVDTSSYISK